MGKQEVRAANRKVNVRIGTSAFVQGADSSLVVRVDQ